MLQIRSSDLFHMQIISACNCVISSENKVPSYSINDLLVIASVRKLIEGKIKLAFSLLN